MDFNLWDVIDIGMTIWGDVIISLTLFSAILILFGALISSPTRKPPRWTQQWEAFLIGIVFSLVGYAVKFGADNMPFGAFFKFSRLTAGLIIFISITFVVTALWQLRAKRAAAQPPAPED